MNQVVVFMLFAFLYFLFIWKGGKVYPILYLFLFVYFVQYYFSVYLIYNEYPILREQMPMKEEELFEYLVPALFSLFAGVFIFNRDIQLVHLLSKIDRRHAANLGHMLLFISYLFNFLLAIGVPGIQSIMSFTNYLKYAGAMCYLFAPSTFHYMLLGLVYLSLARDALNGGVFIDFFAWCTYMFLLVALKYRFSLLLRTSFIILAIPLLVIVQSVKQDYREMTWTGRTESGLGLFIDIAQQKQEKENDPFAKSEGVVSTVGRLNQGWHVAKVLKWVPKEEGFSDGQDMLGDIEGTVLPRVFFPDKKIIGSKDKFRKYTGHKLIGNTSMTIGVLGDFYINFGYWGSFVGLFIFGAIIARVLHWFVRKYVVPNPINIIWIPFLFSYLVRANNDFYIVINNMFKGYLIFLFINYAVKELLPHLFYNPSLLSNTRK